MHNTDHTTRFDENNYLFNPNSKCGIYLIHGFSSTTYEVKNLANFLADQGYCVKADNLPGHGTSIADCNSVTYIEWLSFVEQGIAEMYSHCNKVIIIGVSMGAVLALYSGTIFPVDGIIAASAVFKFKNEFNVRVLNRLFHRFKYSVPKKSTFHPDKMKVAKINFYGYNQYPLYALNEMRKLVDHVKIKLHKISSPVLLMHSTVDQTSPFENFKIIKNQLNTNNLKTLIVDQTGHNMFDTDEDDKEEIFSSIDIFINNIFNNKINE